MEASVETASNNDRYDRVVRRVEMVSGPTGRRRWSATAKGRIVAESYRSRTSVSAVARRHGIVPSQLFTWRKLAREGKLVLPVEDETRFASLVVEAAPASAEASAAPAEQPRSTGSVEIEAAGVVVRLPADTPAARIAEIAVALRAGS